MVEAIRKTDPLTLTVLPQQEENKPVSGITKRFLTIEETADQLGLAVFYLRQGIRSGWIPHIKCGKKSMINVIKLIEILDEQSVNGNCR